MRITRITIVGIALIVLGLTAFAYQNFVFQAHTEGQDIWALTPIVAAAMLVVTGVLLTASEIKHIWSQSGSGL